MDYWYSFSQSVIIFINKAIAEYDSYYWVGFSIYELLNWLLPILVIFSLYLLINHPLFLISKKNNVLPLYWKKLKIHYEMSKCALLLARTEHYGLSPKIDVAIYDSKYFSTIEMLALGSEKYVLIVPEKKWNMKNDELIAKLLQPQCKLSRTILCPNTLSLFFSNGLKSLQARIFSCTKIFFKNKDIQQFFILSLYFFFLPIVYTRLSLRLHIYKKLMTKLYGIELAKTLSADLEKELADFLHQPISYFFGLINEKN